MPSGLLAGASALFVAGAVLSFGEAARQRAKRLVAAVIGEDRVSQALDEAGAMDRLDGLVIRARNGRAAQIDHVARGALRLVAIETKNWSGTLEGGARDQEWIQVRPNGTRQVHRNPISQVKRQARILSQHTGLPVAWLVVMAGRTEPLAGSFPEGVVRPQQLTSALPPLLAGPHPSGSASPQEIESVWQDLAERAASAEAGEGQRYGDEVNARHGRREWVGWAAMSIATAAAATALGSVPLSWPW